MKILGIETSTTVCSVGLSGDEGESIERSMVEAHVHSEKLQTMVQDILKDARMHVQEIDAVAVSIGPGSFTGLRIGLSTAKGLCFSVDKPLIGVPTFEAIASAAARSFPAYERFLVVLDAKQSDVYTGSFRNYSGFIEAETSVSIRPARSFGQEVNDGKSTLVITDALKTVNETLGRRIPCADVHDFCHGAVVASLGIRKYLAKEFNELSSTEPLYLKDFVVKPQSLQTHA